MLGVIMDVLNLYLNRFPNLYIFQRIHIVTSQRRRHVIRQSGHAHTLTHTHVFLCVVTVVV